MKSLRLVIISISICFGMFAACKRGDSSANKTTQGDEIVFQKREIFGASLDETGALSLGDVLTNLDHNDTILCKVSGYVKEVCQVKGCWMTLVSGGQDTSELLVKFKDYAFFMPKDLGGSKVILDGVAFTEVTPVDELKHYAEDEGKSQAEIELITKPEVQKKFMANGVLVLERN
ncbi:MAG TPA: DUF4920 domain-containing protein [Saprospiraceae bacterium]|nr:DUF4920 domain-containing protein [Saprospiraceae bacterium]